jgi:hypothetical protein
MMDATTRQSCPLCRSELCAADAVRRHLIADPKRSATEADELVARFDTAKPIAQPESEPHLLYWAATKPAGDGQSSTGGRAAQGAGVK